MAQEEVTGADKEELKKMEGHFYNTSLYLEHDIPFEVAYCLCKIGKQPEDYDGPQRYCKKRASKKDASSYQGGKYTSQAYKRYCRFHRFAETDTSDNLDDPLTAAIKAGIHAEDKHLKMDFNEAEQILYDSIMEDWPEIYDWPDRSEDPVRYRMLRRVAVNEVRSVRAEDYLDEEGEVHIKEIPTENGVQEEEVENPISREYRLLMSEITNQLRELGLTPKERQKMDTLESQADKDDAITEVASDALDGEGDYDPNQFDE